VYVKKIEEMLQQVQGQVKQLQAPSTQSIESESGHSLQQQQ